jgi:hypothetical protein
VLDLLEARAQFDGPERTLHIRTAEHAGQIYLDLADDSRWRPSSVVSSAYLLSKVATSASAACASSARPPLRNTDKACGSSAHKLCRMLRAKTSTPQGSHFASF